MSTPALCEFVAPDLDESEDRRMHCKAAGRVWAITAGYERDLATESIKLTSTAGNRLFKSTKNDYENNLNMFTFLVRFSGPENLFSTQQLLVQKFFCQMLHFQCVYMPIKCNICGKFLQSKIVTER